MADGGLSATQFAMCELIANNLDAEILDRLITLRAIEMTITRQRAFIFRGESILPIAPVLPPPAVEGPPPPPQPTS